MLEHNLALLRALDRFRDLAAGVFAGVSRKAMIGTLTGRPAGAARAAGSAAAALIAAQRGAMIVRVHDVAATRDALAVWQAVHEGDAPAKAASKPFGSQRFGDD
jgi:dihydropteroate synthase